LATVVGISSNNIDKRSDGDSVVADGSSKK